MSTAAGSSTNNNNNNNGSSSAAGSGGSSNSNSFTAYHFASFAAMEVTVTMVPRFTMPRVSTSFGGRYGPFAPNYPVEVPLWLALHIRQTDACVINPPPFMTLPYLRGVADRERENESTFEAIPFYFFEVVKKVCEHGAAADDIPHVAEVIRLTAEVKAMRRQKLQRSMAVFEAEGSPVYIPGIKLTNIVNNELEFLRGSFARVLQQAAEMKRRRERLVGGPVEGSTPQRPPTMTTTRSGAGTSTNISTSDSGSFLTDTPLRGAEQTTAMTMTMTPSQDMTAETMTTTTTTTTTTETTTATAMEGMASPPVKKRRTLRQT